MLLANMRSREHPWLEISVPIIFILICAYTYFKGILIILMYGKDLVAMSAVMEVCWHENKIILSIRVEQLSCCKCIIIIKTLLILFCKAEQNYQIRIFKDYTQIFFKIILCRLCACIENAAIFVAIMARGVLRETARGSVCSWFANLSFSKGSILRVVIWYADPHASKVSFDRISV
jgi:hypothetical protein